MDSWDIRDGKAYSIIVKQLSNTLIFKHILMLQTSKELWESIMAQFEEQNMGISAFYTYAEMMNLKWDGSTDIHEHISKLRSAKQRLAGMKRKVNEEFMAFALLHSLPKST
ncbi:hypothetical protein K439DRAFT_1343532 [Ramaria rubella]|nr:hypothetical protein K439DRAFT_1343532 [Ramaria rubella]